MARPIRNLIGALGCFTLFSATAAAAAMPIESFKELSTERQGAYITQTLRQLANHYRENGLEQRQECMETYFTSQTGDKVPDGIRELRRAIYGENDLRTVEQAVLVVTERQCNASYRQ